MGIVGTLSHERAWIERICWKEIGEWLWVKSELVRKKGTIKVEKGSRGRDRCSKAEEEENSR